MQIMIAYSHTFHFRRLIEPNNNDSILKETVCVSFTLADVLERGFSPLLLSSFQTRNVMH